MARTIDLTKQLSDADRQYLVERDRWRDLAIADGHEDPAQARREAESGTRPTQVSSTILRPTDPGGLPRAQSPALEAEDEDPPYEDWSFDDLKAELDDRKAVAIDAGMTAEEAGKRYSKGGSQKDLVARLYEDDNATTQG